MKLEFKVLGGKSCTAEVNPSDTVAQVKSIVGPKLEVDPEGMLLVVKGKLLKSTDTLEGAHVAENTCVHVVSRKTAAPGSAAPAAGAAPAASGAASATGASSAAPSAPPSNPFPTRFEDLDGLGGLGGLGFPSPAMMSQMMQQPQVQEMMQSFMSNPQLMLGMLQNNPMLRSLTENNPMLRESLSNPEMLRTMFSPEAMQGAMEFMSRLSGGNNPQQGGGQPGGLDLGGIFNMLGGMGGGMGGGFPPTGAAPAAPAAGGAAAPTDSRPLRERFAEQIRVLKDMGFLDEDANAQALLQTNGNVDAAITNLLARGFGN